MTIEMQNLDRNTARDAWGKFCEKGTATRQAARLLHVGLQDYLDIFARKYLGAEGTGESCKLVLGSNGEGKTHLLYCLRERALQSGHLVAMVEAKSVGAGMSPFIFGQELLLRLESPGSLVSPLDDENNLIRVLRESVERKREVLLSEGLDPDDLLPEWADAMRTKNLLPMELASALADGLQAAVRRDVEGLLDAVRRMTFEKVKLSKDQQQVQGANLLKSIVLIPRLLGFLPLVLLIDEAEMAVEKAGSNRRRAFLGFLRFVNDHMVRGDGSSSVVVIACTDDFWPGQFAEYTALKGRLSDPGYDSIESRLSLTHKALVNKNKLWVRETFRGRMEDYVTLGEGLVRIGSKALGGVDEGVQRCNVEILGRIASSSEVAPFIKRPFVKALAQLIQDQVGDDAQRILTENEARSKFDLAAKEIVEEGED